MGLLLQADISHSQQLFGNNAEFKQVTTRFRPAAITWHLDLPIQQCSEEFVGLALAVSVAPSVTSHVSIIMFAPDIPPAVAGNTQLHYFN